VNVEREVKLRATEGFLLPDLNVDGFRVASSHEDRTVTTYLDTRDQRLRRWGVSLRHRSGEGWTVKLPLGEDGSALARAEHVFAGDDPARIPREALDLVSAFTRRERPRPLVTMRTLRRSFRLVDANGAPVATVTDDAVQVAGDADRRRRRWFRRSRPTSSPRRFRELEIELASDADARAADTIVEALQRAGAGAVDLTPKLERALGDGGVAPEIRVDELDGDATVEQVVRTTIARSVARLIEHDAAVRLGHDEEAVHQARVATRRLRSDLRTFRRFVDERWANGLRADLKRLAGALGAVRDAEVQLERLRSRAALLGPNDGRALDRLLSVLVERRALARSRLLRTMRDRSYLELLDRLVEAAREPRVLPGSADVIARTELGAVMRKPWKRLRAAVVNAETVGTNVALHGVRIRAKRVRYAAEALEPVFGKDAKRFATATADLQGILGEHQDGVVADAFLRDAGARSIAEAFVAGELAAIEAQARRVARAAWPEVWGALDQRRLRFWA
jgi:CHAD domain-containing protein